MSEKKIIPISGSTKSYSPRGPDAFQKYQTATGGVPDKATGLLKITSAQFNKLKPLVFSVGGSTYSFSPDAQIWPRVLNLAIGGELGAIYLIVSDLGSNSGSGLDFINGFAFLYVFPCITAVIWDSC